MARNKNALRQHLIADVDLENMKEVPTDGDFLALEKWITDIEDGSDETVDAYADYAGDGTEKDEVTMFKEAYDVTGTYDPKDPAQALVASKKRLLGDGRKVWHRIISADGTASVTGLATLSGIVAGSGNAAEFEAFGCRIAFDEIAKEDTP
ncbi:phage tail tube protein [Marinilactibacillus sp. Marseille-P9653]|uniref:phage tail tube protein n=1 Tax=Marinilactibacillus sp. Marseille-P9653 TaxID=2866583 RepID=UPI001CE41911|nr:phage tail protein [Marinilactibacillus sp. Marseille-P9653]